MADNVQFCVEFHSINENIKDTLKSFFCTPCYKLNPELKEKAKRNRYELEKFLQSFSTIQ